MALAQKYWVFSVLIFNHCDGHCNFDRKSMKRRANLSSKFVTGEETLLAEFIMYVCQSNLHCIKCCHTPNLI